MSNIATKKKKQLNLFERVQKSFLSIIGIKLAVSVAMSLLLTFFFHISPELMRYSYDAIDLKYFEGCGQVKGFVGTSYGGEFVKANQWPWIVALIHREYGYFCGGTLLSERHVLSVAHCVHYKGQTEKASANQVLVVLGRHDLSLDEPLSVTSFVEEIIIHPDWNVDDQRFDADIAMIILRDEVAYTDFIQPICLPRHERQIVGAEGTLVGWGKSEDVAIHETRPKMLTIPIISADFCYTTFPQLANYGSTRAFCGGYVNANKAPCHGDSGSGLFVKDKKFPYSWIIDGLVSGSLSIGSTCDVNKFSIYTNVTSFGDWIFRTMNETKAKLWEDVVFTCTESDDQNSTTCTHSYIGTSQNLKMKADFSQHEAFKTANEVKNLVINLGESNTSTNVLLELHENFKNIEELVLEGASLTFIERNYFKKLISIQSLTFVNHSIEFILEDAFQDLTKLTNLTIENSKVQSRANILLINSKSLKSLIFRNNKLSIFSDSFFSNLDSLETLVLTENPLKTLPDNVFRRLDNLITLELESCELTELSDNTFSNLIELRNLNLRLNRLTHLNEDLLKNNVNLKSVDLWGNKITTCDIDFEALHHIAQFRLTLDRENLMKNVLFSNDTNLSEKKLSDSKIHCALPKHIKTQDNGSSLVCKCGFKTFSFLQKKDRVEATRFCKRLCKDNDESMFWCQNSPTV